MEPGNSGQGRSRLKGEKNAYRNFDKPAGCHAGGRSTDRPSGTTARARASGRVRYPGAGAVQIAARVRRGDRHGPALSSATGEKSPSACRQRCNDTHGGAAGNASRFGPRFRRKWRRLCHPSRRRCQPEPGRAWERELVDLQGSDRSTERDRPQRGYRVGPARRERADRRHAPAHGHR